MLNHFSLNKLEGIIKVHKEVLYIFFTHTTHTHTHTHTYLVLITKEIFTKETYHKYYAMYDKHKKTALTQYKSKTLDV